METTEKNINTKTHRRLRKAYCRLIKEKGMDKVTVSALTEEADISRATFYLYYQNIEEFKDEALEYIISLYIKQLRIFLSAGTEELKQVCKKSSLIFTDSDFELFACHFDGDRGFGFSNKILDLAFKNFADNIPQYFDAKFVKKNKSRFDLFYIGYTGVMRPHFLDYHSDKVYRDVLRTMRIWNYLFPEHKFKCE